MQVTFGKLSGRRYTVAIARDVGPELAPRQGPGYHDHLPHDAVHFLVESEAGITGGVFGQLASGRSTIFTTVDPALRRRQARRDARRPRSTTRVDMARSEDLASIGLALWEARHGLRREVPISSTRNDHHPPSATLIESILRRLDQFAGQWTPLPVGGSVTLRWSPAPPGAAPRGTTRARSTRRAGTA